MSGPIDFDGINRAALASARSLLPELLPGGKFRSLEYISRNPRRADQNIGSFSVNYKTGIWKDFASGDGGCDLISLVAFTRGTSQGDAARELANRLGINGAAVPNRTATPRQATEASEPTVMPWGDDGPPVRNNEARRHPYKNNDGIAVRIKIKFNDSKYANWYRVFDRGSPAGWQAKKPDDYESVPYVAAGLDPLDLEYDQVLWPEGEKDVDNLGKLGLPALTFGGVGDGLPAGIKRYLSGRHIVILADNDSPGQEHAAHKAEICHAAGAASVRTVHFTELPSKGDVSDYIANGGTRDSLLALIDAVPIVSPPAGADAKPIGDDEQTGLIVRTASDIEAEPITWLWPNRIALGKQTLIAGDPGLGKSQLTAFLTAVITTGGEWPCGEGRAERGSVVIFSAEDDAADTIKPRLIAAGADCTRVQIAEAVTADDGKGNRSRRMFHLEADLAHLEALLSKTGDVRLVIIDPITAYLGGVDTHRNSDVRGVLGLVAEMAARRRIAVVVISHWNKSGAGSAMNRITGSGAFVAAVRAAFMVAKDPDDDSDTRRLFVPMKNNLARTDGGLAFRLEQRLVGEREIVASAVTWESERVTRTADEILAAADSAGEHRSARDEAIEWLKELLAEGPLDAKEIRAQAEGAGLTWATVRRAKDRLGIRPERRSEGCGGEGKWLWALPTERAQGAQESQDAHVPDVSTLGRLEHLGGREGDR
jgi:putative DNA primase/helicase